MPGWYPNSSHQHHPSRNGRVDMPGSREFKDRASAVSYARHLKKKGYDSQVIKRGDTYYVVPL